MERTPEPELMDDPEQAAAYGGADWSESHGRIPEYFHARFGAGASGRVLDLGCGTADVTIRFVKANPGICALGVDGSEAMLTLGRRFIREAGLESRIALERRFLPDPFLETRAFDAVIANSLLHHIADPVGLWHTACRSAKPGAPVMLIDLRRPPDHATAVELVAQYGNDIHPVLRRDFVASLHAAYTADEVRHHLNIAGLPGFRVEETDALHLLAWGRAPAEISERCE